MNMVPKISLSSFERFVFSAPETRAKRSFLSPLMVTSFVYQALATLRLKVYQKGLFYSRKLPIPVISVGNLTVGGTGKTPTTLYLARLLQNQGRRVAVLSRGYQGNSSRKVNVVSDDKRILLGHEEAGDEPFLMAEKLPGVPVLTGKDRGLLGDYAWKRFSIEVVILDDGFQHLMLQRDLDILLLDGHNPFGNGYLLPRGSLREPPQHLKRADLILVTQPDKVRGQEDLTKKIRPYNDSAPIFFAHYAPVMLEKLNQKEKVSLDYLQGKKVTALAGIARPESFFFLLTQLGAKVVDTIVYLDHHRYKPQNLEKGEAASVIVTTEKDAVKLRPLPLPEREIFILGVELKVEKEAEFQKILRNYLPSIL